MVFPPREIILRAAKNYLSEEKFAELDKDLRNYKRLTDVLFLNTLQKHFDIRLFRDKPFIKEDIWLFNYLMYETGKSDNFNPLRYGEELCLKGRFLRIGLIDQYERKIILPKLIARRENAARIKKEIALSTDGDKDHSSNISAFEAS